MNRCRRWPGWLLYGITMRMFVSRLHKINLTITKGGKERTLFVPSFLLDETHQYIRYVRRRVVLASRRRVGCFASAALWLGRWGTRVSTSAIRSAFRRGLENARLTEGRFHDLRHAYAITMLDKLMQDSADPKSRSREPLKALKRLLGHSSITSTEIYLRARKEYLDDIEPDDFELPGLVARF
jgi:integrase/recombinase XerD